MTDINIIKDSNVLSSFNYNISLEKLPINLKLLRKAKAWYLWLHIKDFPGAHGIIEKNKTEKVDQATLAHAAREVVKQSVSGHQDEDFDVIYAECRYVRPIKGGKSGQVTFTHEKVLRVKV